MRKYITLTVALLLTLAACTSKERARRFGGSSRAEIEPCQKLEVVTWKEADLWILTRPMHPDDSVETHTFREDSSYGIMEGVVTISESRNENCPTAPVLP